MPDIHTWRLNPGPQELCGTPACALLFPLAEEDEDFVNLVGVFIYLHTHLPDMWAPVLVETSATSLVSFIRSPTDGHFVADSVTCLL